MVRSYTIDESLVAQAVKASGNRPVEQVLTEALQEYAAHRLPSSTSSPTTNRQAEFEKWLEEGSKIPLREPATLPAPTPSSADLSHVLTDKFRRQGLVL